MRHAKISALIHNSIKHPNLPFCSVEVYFQHVQDKPDGTALVIPESELIVSRKAFRNNSSRYAINGRESSFQEVTSLLKERGIDLGHKRFLILQGEVESIAQMKPKAENEHDDGLLEYLEDIIGTSDFKKAIEEAQTKLDTVNEECVEKGNRLKIVEKEMSSLQGQRDEILQHLSMENQVTQKRSALLQLYIHSCKNKIELNTQLIKQQSERLEQELSKTQNNKEEVEGLKAQVKAKQIELDSLKKGFQESSKFLSKLEIEKVQIEEKKKHLDAKRKKLEKAIETGTHAHNESKIWLENYEEESRQLQEQVQELENRLEVETAGLERIQEELKDKTQGFTDEIEKKQKIFEPWQEKIRAKESEIAVANSEIDVLNEKTQALEKAVNDAKENVESIMNEGREKESRLVQLKQELEHTTSQIGLGVGECQQAREKVAEMRANLDSSRQKVSTARESLNSFESQNKVLSALMKISNSGRIEGIHGRLGGLGTIDAKYDIAISTACPSLDNIVVDTVETGQQCIQYLRKNDLGRAKFILLNKLPQKDLSPIATPENVPRLFDLVTPREAIFAPAFYSVLGDTLVAEDTEQARRIAYGQKRWRVVTLEGMLIETSGAMSGGGNHVAQGGMKDKASQDISRRKFQQMEELLGKEEERFQLAESTLQKMEDALKELQERKPQIETDIGKVQLDMGTLTKSLAEGKQQYKELSAEFKSTRPDSDALKAAEEKVSMLEDELASLNQQSKNIVDEIEALQGKILQVGGVQLRLQQSKVEGIVEQIELANTKLSNGALEKTKAEKELEKHGKAIKSAMREISESSEATEQLRSQLENLIKSINQIEVEVSQASDVVDEKEEALAALKAELDSKQKDIDAVRSIEIEIRNAIESNEKTIRDETRAMEIHHKEIRELTLHNMAELRGEQRQDGDMSTDDEREDVLVEYSPDEIESLDKAKLKQEIAELQQRLQDVRIDTQILKDYQRRQVEFESRRDILNEAVRARDELKKTCSDLRMKRQDEFMVGFNAISMKLKEMYQMITMGGNAELELVDSLDPFSEGILFSVMPPKKSWKNISNLSGGEKTLSSLALVFALHHYKPTPLYVMDEIDAALDFRNVSIVATYIKERTKNGQFIVISLRNNMFELAKQLVGIYKVNNMTKSVALKNDDYVHRSEPDRTHVRDDDRTRI